MGLRTRPFPRVASSSGSTEACPKFYAKGAKKSFKQDTQCAGYRRRCPRHCSTAALHLSCLLLLLLLRFSSYSGGHRYESTRQAEHQQNNEGKKIQVPYLLAPRAFRIFTRNSTCTVRSDSFSVTSPDSPAHRASASRTQNTRRALNRRFRVYIFYIVGLRPHHQSSQNFVT